jgi:maltose-binding protein MalE
MLLAACDGAAPPARTPAATAPTSAGTPVTLVLWHSWAPQEQAVLGRLVDTYNQSHPLVRVIPRSMPRATLASELQMAALDGSGPHLLLLPSHTLGRLVANQLLLNLNDRISPAQLELLLPAATGSAQVRNDAGAPQLYGLPLVFDTPALYYNKDNVLTPPADTDALLTIARGLSDLTQPPLIWGLAYNMSLDNTIGYLDAFGGRVFDEQGQLVLAQEGRAGTERWLQWLLELHQDQRLLAVPDSLRVDGVLKARQALMTVDWANQLGAYRALWPTQLGVAPLPQLSATGAAPAAYVQSEVLSINARVRDGHEQQAALDFGTYLLGAEAQRELLRAGMQPTLLSLELDAGVLPGEDPALIEAARAFRDQAARGKAMPNSPAEVETVWPALVQMQRTVLQGQLSPAEAVTQTDARLRASLGGK